MKRVVSGLFLWMAVLQARELDMHVRSMAADGRIRITSRQAEWLPSVSVWSERALEQLERDWRTKIPFQAGAPLEIQMDDRIRAVELQSSFRDGRFRQRILIPEVEEAQDTREIARVFVRAMAQRRLMVEEEAREDVAERPPNWSWLDGAALRLVSGRGRDAIRRTVAQTRVAAPPPPGQGSDDDSAHALVLYSWVREQVFSNRKAAARFWVEAASIREFGVDAWVRVAPGVESLRELNQQWAVWWAAERRLLIAEYRLEDEAAAWLEEELRPVPAFLGLGHAEDRDRLFPAALPDMASWLEDPVFSSALGVWLLRLQAVRFRQGREIFQRVATRSEALRIAREAARRRGAARERAWASAVAAWSGGGETSGEIDPGDSQKEGL